MDLLKEFQKACPEGFCVCEKPMPGQQYKYFVSGKGCTLGVLFEDSINVYYEWLEEDGEPVDYPPEIRYKWWSKQDLARLLSIGVWEATSGQDRVAA
jgi:hypothetical protein